MKRAALLIVVAAAAFVPSASAQTPSWYATDIGADESGAAGKVGYRTNLAGYRLTTANMTLVSGAPAFDGCEVLPATVGGSVSGATTSAANSSGTEGFAVFAGLVPPCNGTYAADLVLVAQRVANCGNWLVLEPACDYHEGGADTTVTYAIVPPDPVDVTAKLNSDRSVTVSWTSPYNEDNPAPPDFLGFGVARLDSEGEPTELAVDQAETEFRDTAVPAEGGAFTYQVVTLRAGADDETYAKSEVVSTEEVTVPAAPPDASSTSTTAPGPTDGGGAGGGVSTGGSSRGSRGSPFSVPKPTTTTTTLPDEGFEEVLPYQSEPGEEEAQPPLDLLRDEDGGGPSLTQPVAVSLVLAVWAMHILYVTRAAQRANALAPAVVVTPISDAEPPPPPPPPPSALPTDDAMSWWASGQVPTE